MVMDVNATVLITALVHVIMWMAAVAVKKDIQGRPVTEVKMT